MRVPVLVGMLVASPLSCIAADWCSLDSSEFFFETTFEGETLPGEFHDFDVALSFDPAAPGTGSLQVSVDLRSADLGDPEMNEILVGPVWFHSGKFGEAVFQSATIGAGESGAFVADGVLALKGRKQRVAVPFLWESTAAGNGVMRGEFALRRTDFDVGSGEWADGDAIGIDVRLRFTVRLERCE